MRRSSWCFSLWVPRLESRKCTYRLTRSLRSFVRFAPSFARSQVTQGSLFARITHPTEGAAYVEFTDDPEPYRSSGTVDRLGVQVVKLQQMGGVLARMEQQLSMHEAWLKEVSRELQLISVSG